MKKYIFIIVLPLIFFGCTQETEDVQDVYNQKINAQIEKEKLDSQKKIIFLHHSTGENIWNGGVEELLDDYNVTEQWYPSDSDNMPYDYWNIWINEATDEQSLDELAENYDLIIFKHCYPVSYVEEEDGSENIGSEKKTLSSYKLQYTSLKKKMLEYSDTKFLVWTGAVLIKDETDQDHAERAQEFFTWVKEEWDEAGDNIYIWDFYSLQTEGGLYFKDKYSDGDSHPNESFSQTVASDFAQEIIKTIND